MCKGPYPPGDLRQKGTDCWHPWRSAERGVCHWHCYCRYERSLPEVRTADAHCDLQEEAFATGIDTAVVGGSYLTGLLLPGANALQKVADDGPMTLDKLHGKLIKVKAKKNYLAASF